MNVLSVQTASDLRPPRPREEDGRNGPDASLFAVVLDCQRPPAPAKPTANVSPMNAARKPEMLTTADAVKKPPRGTRPRAGTAEGAEPGRRRTEEAAPSPRPPIAAKPDAPGESGAGTPTAEGTGPSVSGSERPAAVRPHPASTAAAYAAASPGSVLKRAATLLKADGPVPAPSFAAAGDTTPAGRTIAESGAALRRQASARLAESAATMSGPGTLELDLSSPELGKVEVTFVREGRDLRLEFRAETATAARALEDGRHKLEAALLRRGGNWNRVEISVSCDGDADPQEGERDRDGRRTAATGDRTGEQAGARG